MSRKTAQPAPKGRTKTEAQKPRGTPKAAPAKPRKAGSPSRKAAQRKPGKAMPGGAGRDALWLRVADYALGLALLAAGVWGLVMFRRVL